MTADFVQLLRRPPGYTQQIVHVQQAPPRAARFAAPTAPLSASLAQLLAARGITQLYAHQAAALDAARSGDHLGVVTATASGKTLCFQLPTLESIIDDSTSRALFLFPTKALAHDQLRSLSTLADPLNVRVATLDGDTPRTQRDTVRARAQIVLSNPDMLHRSVLPAHQRWAALLGNLRYVVLDEAHVYRGVFGTHTALVLRRLRRLCAHYGSAPQFICCSATNANPAEHLAALVGDRVTIIDDDGAPQGPRTFVFWNPPFIEQSTSGSQQPGGKRRSTNIETANVLTNLVQSGVKTLAFTRTRRGAELVLRYTREALERDIGRIPIVKNVLPASASVAAYRAGYAPEQRRQLEQAFLHDQLLGLISTNALELGVDIGGVDAVVIGGFPGTVASMWQQAGRAGRSQGNSLAVLVAQDDPLDQFYMRYPEQFFARPHEHARVALDNPYILSDQLRCAASELPLHDADEVWFGPTFKALRDWLIRHGDLRAFDDERVVAMSANPAAQVNIRSADGEPVALKDSAGGRTIEQVSATRAPSEVYPGAIYLHQGDSYLVTALYDRVAEARRCDVNYYTQPREEVDVVIERVRRQRRIGPTTLSLGVVEVTRRVTGYRRKEHYSEAVLSEHDLSLPPTTFRTIAVWWTVPEPICRQVEQACGEVVDGLHAMEHACIGLLPLFAQCDRADIGGLSTNVHPDTGMATIFVYDGVPGGVGIAQIGYEQAEEWWKQTRTLLIDCLCAEGCPACIQSPKCGNGNQHLSKIGAATLASLLLDQPTPTRDLRVPLSQATAAGAAVSTQGVLADLRGRLDRVRATPPGPRRAALLTALRYRMRIERSAIATAAGHDAFTALEREISTL
jgi:DEAD/DEAH box helicase domain-containing protein